MKDITSRPYGAADEVVELVDVDELEMGYDEVLVQVDAALVNAADWHLLRGAPYIAGPQFRLGRPNFRIPSSDLAGTVRAAGRHVTGIEPGDEVFGTTSTRGFGTFAELLSAPQTVVAPKPARLTFAEAAASPLAASTTLQTLRDHRRVAPGDDVPIVGGSGGVDTLAAPIAKAFGAEVTGVCSTHDLDLVRSQGAEHVLDHTTTDFAKGPGTLDLIIQAARTHSPTAYRSVLRPGGTLVQVSGDSNHRWIRPLGRIAGAAALSPFVTQRMTSFTVDPNTSDLQVLAELDDVAAAIRHVEDGRTRGKAVIMVPPFAASQTATTHHETHRS